MILVFHVGPHHEESMDYIVADKSLYWHTLDSAGPCVISGGQPSSEHNER